MDAAHEKTPAGIEAQIEQSSLDASVEDEEFTAAEIKSIIRRVDIRVVGVCAFGYSCQLMDRTNVGYAAISGLLTDLDFTGYDYSLCVLLFFVTYVLFQFPSTVLIREIGPRYFLTAIVVCWGVLNIGMGFVKHWTAVLALRIVLGIFAAGYFPGCVYLLSTWYTRFELQKRFAVFYGTGCAASSLAGILAYAFMQLSGDDGIAGWSWIFILEGVITVLVAVVLYIFLVPFADQAAGTWRFLTPKECAFMVRRIDKDRKDAILEGFTWGKFLRPALDIKLWCYALMFGCLTTNTYAMAYFLPIILSEGLGFGVGASLCLSAPPWFFAGLIMFATSWVADRYRKRVPVLVFNACLSIIGLPLMGFATNTGARLVGAFLTVAGANANVPATMAWQANNIRGQWTRAFASALLVAFDGVGGIVSSLVFESDAPKYRPGIWTALGANIVLLIVIFSLTMWYRHCNKRADRGQFLVEGIEGFRYTL